MDVNVGAGASADVGAGASMGTNASAGASMGACVDELASANAGAPASSAALIALTQSGMARWDSPSAGLSIPMPFKNRICLIEDTHVAGTTHIKGIEQIAAGIAEGQELRLEREPDNLHDRWAIRVYAGDKRIGFVPCDTNEILARLMDGGKCVGAKATYQEKLGIWNKIHMEVYLDD